MDVLILDTRCGSSQALDGFVEDELLAHVQLECASATEQQLCVIIVSESSAEIVLKPPYKLRDAFEKLQERKINALMSHSSAGSLASEGPLSLAAPARALALCKQHIDSLQTSYRQRIVLASGSLLFDDAKNVEHAAEFNAAVNSLLPTHGLELVHFFDAFNSEQGEPSSNLTVQTRLQTFFNTFASLEDVVQQVQVLHRATLWKLLNQNSSESLRRCFIKFPESQSRDGTQDEGKAVHRGPLSIEADVLCALRAVPVLRKITVCACHGGVCSEVLQKSFSVCPRTKKRLARDKHMSGAQLGNQQVYFPKDIQFKSTDVTHSVDLQVVERVKATSVNLSLLYGDPLVLSPCSYLQHSIEKLVTLSTYWISLLDTLRKTNEALIVQAPSSLDGQCICKQRMREEEPPRTITNSMLYVLMPDINDPALAVIKPIATSEMVQSMSGVLHALPDLKQSAAEVARIKSDVDDHLHALGSASNYNPLQHKSHFDKHVGIFINVGHDLATFPQPVQMLESSNNSSRPSQSSAKKSKKGSTKKKSAVGALALSMN
jgi:hypothetical protein